MRFIKFILLTLLSLSWNVGRTQGCDCSIEEVQNNTVAPCKSIIGIVDTVFTVSELKNAINQANNGGNRTILIADGTYQVASTASFPYISADNVVIRSLSGNRAGVVIRGGGMQDVSPNTENGFLIGGDNVTIADLTIEQVGNHAIQVSGHNLFVHNVHIRDTYQQMIKGATSADSISSAVVQCSLFEYTAGIGPNYYIGGLDIHKGRNWLVRVNVFKHIISPSGSVAEHAVHFWNNCADNVVEGNQIINCDRGIGFGLGSSPNSGGIIRNNMIYNDGTGSFNDVGIGLETSPNTRVYNNTIHIEYVNAIEYRFPATTGVEIKNNLTNQKIRLRDGATGIVANNVSNAQAGWYTNATSGDLHLSAPEATVVDQGADLTGWVNDDFDQEGRPQGGGYDIGADEYTITVDIKRNSLGLEKSIKLYPNPSNHKLFYLQTNEDNLVLEIFTTYGKSVHQEKVYRGENQIRIEGIVQGVYFYRVTGAQGILESGSLVIQ